MSLLTKLDRMRASPNEPWRLIQLIERQGSDVHWNVDDGTVEVHLRQGSSNDVPERKELEYRFTQNFMYLRS